MARFSISKMMADPAATQLNDVFQPEVPETDPSASPMVKRGSRRSSIKSSSRHAHRANLDSLDELENFARALQRANPKVVAKAISQVGKKKSSSASASA